MLGSLAEGTHFRERSDIDLAAGGLRPSEHFSALGRLLTLSGDFEFDLAALGACPSGLRAVRSFICDHPFVHAGWPSRGNGDRRRFPPHHAGMPQSGGRWPVLWSSLARSRVRPVPSGPALPRERP